MLEQEAFQLPIFASNQLSAVRHRYKSKVKQLRLAFTLDEWASHTNIISDLEQNFLEQQVPKSNFHSKLTHFTLQNLISVWISNHALRIDTLALLGSLIRVDPSV